LNKHIKQTRKNNIKKRKIAVGVEGFLLDTIPNKAIRIVSNVKTIWK
jgi:hypothetical protein